MNRALLAAYTAFGLIAVLVIAAVLLNHQPDPNTDNARNTVQHAGVPAGVTPGPDWRQP